jgi:hypothetical protein
VRHDLGLSKTERRFPAKNTCLAIYSRVVNAEASLADVLATNFPWCREWEGGLKKLFGNYVEAKQRQNVLDYDDLLLHWAQLMQEGEIARDVDTAAITSRVTTSKIGVSSIVLSWPKRRAAAPTNAKASIAANFQCGLKLTLRRSAIAGVTPFLQPPARAIASTLPKPR